MRGQISSLSPSRVSLLRQNVDQFIYKMMRSLVFGGPVLHNNIPEEAASSDAIGRLKEALCQEQLNDFTLMIAGILEDQPECLNFHSHLRTSGSPCYDIPKWLGTILEYSRRARSIDIQQDFQKYTVRFPGICDQKYAVDMTAILSNTMSQSICNENVNLSLTHFFDYVIEPFDNIPHLNQLLRSRYSTLLDAREHTIAFKRSVNDIFEHSRPHDSGKLFELDKVAYLCSRVRTIDLASQMLIPALTGKANHHLGQISLNELPFSPDEGMSALRALLSEITNVSSYATTTPNLCLTSDQKQSIHDHLVAQTSHISSSLVEVEAYLNGLDVDSLADAGNLSSTVSESEASGHDSVTTTNLPTSVVSNPSSTQDGAGSIDHDSELTTVSTSSISVPPLATGTVPPRPPSNRSFFAKALNAAAHVVPCVLVITWAASITSLSPMGITMHLLILSLGAHRLYPVIKSKLSSWITQKYVRTPSSCPAPLSSVDLCLPCGPSIASRDSNQSFFTQSMSNLKQFSSSVLSFLPSFMRMR